MDKPTIGTGVEYRLHGRTRGRWRTLLTALSVSLLLPSAAAFALTANIDFEQFAPAPNMCAPQVPQIHVVHAGVATFYRGQLATGLPGAHDQTTVYWSNFQCPPASETISIVFSVPVSNVQFTLENLERDRPTTTYDLCRNGSGPCDQVVLTAPGISRFPSSSTTTVTLPYSGINTISVISEGDEWNFLIDNVTFSFPLPPNAPALVKVFNQFGCAVGGDPGAACAAIQAALLRFGFTFPTATPTETPSPSPCGAIGEPCCLVPGAVPLYTCDAGTCDSITHTCVAPTPTATPSPTPCGANGEPCCLPAAGPPCIAGSCDPFSNTCVAPTPTETASPSACGGPGQTCCVGAGPPCTTGTCDPASNTCP